MFCTANLPLAVQTREFCFLARKTCLARTPSATRPFVAMVLVATISCHTCAGYMDWSSSPWQPRMELQLADVLNKMPWTASVFITRVRMQQVQKLSQDLRIHMWRRCKFISDVIGTVVIIWPTQTTALLRENPSKIPSICIVWSPPIWYFNDLCWYSNETCLSTIVTLDSVTLLSHFIGSKLMNSTSHPC